MRHKIRKGGKAMQVNLLKAKLVEKEMNVEALASLMGRDKATVYRKLNDAEKFTIGEVKQIKKILGLSGEEASAIFLI
jgi:predicted transcriptional regulator